jgi:acyl carrier protein
MNELSGYLRHVRSFVVEYFLFGDPGRLSDETSFIDSGVVDSTGILELIAFLEKSYAITIEDEEIVPENLDSCGKVARFLERKMNGNSRSCNPRCVE